MNEYGKALMKQALLIAETLLACFIILGISLYSCESGRLSAYAEEIIRAKSNDNSAGSSGSQIPLSDDYLKETDYQWAEMLLASKEFIMAAKLFYKAADYRDAWERSMDTWGKIVHKKTIAAGTCHSVAVRDDGIVLAVGDNSFGQCAVSDWKNVISVDAGSFHTVGLRKDGTVLAAGRNDSGQCDVSDWKDIIALSAASSYTLGLIGDGTVLIAGDFADVGDTALDWSAFAECSVELYEEYFPDQTELVQICGDPASTYFALKEDGTIIADRDLTRGMEFVSEWNDIIEIDGDSTLLLALQADGKVLAAGANNKGQCNVGNWSGIQIPKSALYRAAKIEMLGTWRRFLQMLQQKSPELPPWDPWSTEDYLLGIPQYTARSIMLSNAQDLNIDYWTYDLDQNGIEELIIGNVPYYFDGKKMCYMFRALPLGERCHLYLYDGFTKSFYVLGSGGASSGRVGVFQFSDDGYAVVPIRLYDYAWQQPTENIIGVTNNEQRAEDSRRISARADSPWYSSLWITPSKKPLFD